MILISIKNFFKSIGFYFVPLGVIAFFAILSLANIIPSSIDIIKSTFQQISAKIAGSEFNWDHISGVLSNKIMTLSQEDPTQLINMFTNSDLLINLLKETTEEAFGISSLSSDIIELLQGCVNQLMTYVIILFVMIVLGFFVGFVLLNVLVRQFLSNTNFFKALLMALVDGIVGVIFLLIALKINTDNAGLLILFVFGILIVNLVLSLLESYLFFGIKKVKFKKVFNIKNILTLLLGDAIDLVLCLGVVGLCFLSKSLFVAIFIAVPFVLLTIAVLGVNAATYTSTLAKEGKILKRAEIKALKEAQKEEAKQA